MSSDIHSLKGRVALVTGAGSGIGRASALALARSGATIAALSRSRDELDDVVREAGGGEAGHFAVAADIGSEDQMRQAFEEIAGQSGRLDIVVANAGINGVWAPLDQLTVEEWDQTIRTNLRGTFLTLKFALPLLRPHGGSIVVVSSINGTRVFSNSGATAYSCSKAGQVALVRMLALELAKDRIRVNAVCPGAIATDIDQSTELRSVDGLHLPVEFPEGDVPLTGGRSGSAEQVAQLIAFLASDASSHISGTEVFIDGAQSLLQG